MARVYKIHPAIGIARLGNSTEHFVGPEVPGVPARPDGDGKFRDANGRIKRQAARYRIYEYDDAQPAAEPKEVTVHSADVQQIEWTVHLANKKAAWFEFAGPVGEGPQGYPP